MFGMVEAIQCWKCSRQPGELRGLGQDVARLWLAAKAPTPRHDRGTLLGWAGDFLGAVRKCAWLRRIALGGESVESLSANRCGMTGSLLVACEKSGGFAQGIFAPAGLIGGESRS